MKKNKKIMIAASVSAIAAALAITVAAAYDSSDDPLISLSYLTEVFKKEVVTDVEEILEDNNKQLERDIEKMVQMYIEQYVPEQKPDEPVVDPVPPVEADSVLWEVVELKNGDALYAVTPCDISLRRGTVTVIAPDITQGIVDYTAGQELYHNFGLTRDHYCMIPRGDGRGVLATSETVFLMVRGDYTVVKK